MAVTQNLTLTETSYSVADNTSQVRLRWTSTQAGNSYNANSRTATYTFEGVTYEVSYTLPQNSTVVIADKTFTVKHGDDGKKTVSASTWMDTRISAGVVTKTASLKLTDLPRQATLLTAPNFNDEQNPEITYSNPAGNVVGTLQACISLDGSKADVAYKDLSKTGSSYTFTLTEAEREVLRKATTGSNTRTVMFIVKTIINGVTYFSSLNRNYTIVNYAPKLNPTAVDTNTATLALTGDKNKIIKGYNTVAVSSGGTAVKSATIASQLITCGDKKLTSGSGSMEGVESASFNFSITDNRGNTTTQTLNKTLVDYIKLTCNLGNNKPNASGAFTFTASGNYFNNTFGAVANTLSVQYRYKVAGGTYTSWANMTVSLSGNTYNASVNVTGLDYQKTYVFQAKAVDKLATVTTEEKSIKAMPIADWSDDDFKFNVPVSMGAMSADSGSVTTLNIAGQPLSDYVISQGTASGWGYRKWASGVYEQWRTVSSVLSEWTSWVSLYYSMFSVTFASGFTTVPHLQITPCGASWAIPMAEKVTTTGFDLVGLRPNNATAYEYQFSVYAIGRWK